MNDPTSRDIVASEFDEAFYRDRYEVVGQFVSALDHFLAIGWIQGRDPSPEFSTFGYLIRNDDVLFRHVNPFVHYLLSGRNEGRPSSPHISDVNLYLPSDPEVAELLPAWFDREYYLRSYPELQGSPDLLSQYLVLGWTEGRDPCAAFSTHKYLWKFSDAWRRGSNPLVHYLQVGRAEGRAVEPVEGSRYRISPQLTESEWIERLKLDFDPDFYLRAYPWLHGIEDLFAHYRITGWQEGLDPNATFSVKKYLSRHVDVLHSGHEPFLHYMQYGSFEGREVFPSEATPPSNTFGGPDRLTSDDMSILDEFDEAYYRRLYPEVGLIDDCFHHYMTIGWKEGKNPSPHFDTNFYLRNEHDIREAGINPFTHYILHGKREGRRSVRRIPTRADQKILPKISVIVPSYNHAKYLPERLKSILDQSYAHMELIILDDCSTDESRDVITNFAAEYTGECRLVFNDVNSNSVFAQWEKGISLSTGDLIWICESDDTCDSEFLAQTVYLFQDSSVRLVFGNIQFVDQDGNVSDGMTHLRESAQPGIWDEINLMPAAKWFTGPLGVRNLIANVGGAIFRKPSLDAATWAMARTYKVAGDWYLYLRIAGGGQIAYAPAAKAYFRQHGSNVSVTSFDQVSFYKELERFHTFLRETWDVPSMTTLIFYNNLIETFDRSRLASTHSLPKLVSLERMLKVRWKTKHIALAFLNFNVGGGEIFPIEMLNVLHRRHLIVSAVVQSEASDNTFVRAWLDRDIPVYVADRSPVDGEQLASDAQFDIVHSHNIWAEFYFLHGLPIRKLRYFVTLHGSYEVSNIERDQIARFFDQVTWVYIADRNLEKFRQLDFDTSEFRFIPNGLARRLSDNAVTRADLGISLECTVFLFAARSHPDKGWLEAAAAFDLLLQETDRDIVLLMAGDGRESELIQELYRDNRMIKLLGFRGDIDDLLELTDFTLLPTRFGGESMPLTLIQSILAFVPIISVAVGQIKDMLESDFGSAGVAIEPTDDDALFTESLVQEMRKAINGELIVDKRCFEILGKRFSVETCVDKYEVLYGTKKPAAARRSVKQNAS